MRDIYWNLEHLRSRLQRENPLRVQHSLGIQRFAFVRAAPEGVAGQIYYGFVAKNVAALASFRRKYATKENVFVFHFPAQSETFLSASLDVAAGIM